jgi:hypothetical protein
MGMNCLLVCSRSADWSKVQCENEQDNSLKKTEPNVIEGQESEFEVSFNHSIITRV